jgi:hypothetical protein
MAKGGSEVTVTSGGLNDDEWNTLLRRIHEGRCTPFIGPGARAQMSDEEFKTLLARMKDDDAPPIIGPGEPLRFPDAYRITRAWADEYRYPLWDCLDLPKVARYVSVKGDAATPKEKIVELHKKIGRPEFGDESNRDDPHRVLAGLPFPIYITTNQDAFMYDALVSRGKSPERDLCRWSEKIPKNPPSVFDRRRNPPYAPHRATPLVFHLYGHTDSLQSLVVSDDDYIEFLINVSKYKNRVPPQIEGVMSGAALMLLGYRLDDWDFRVLFHILIGFKSLGMTHVAVQLSPAENESARALEERVIKHLEVYQTYVGEYFLSKNLKIRVVPQTCKEFVLALRDKWERSSYAD